MSCWKATCFPKLGIFGTPLEAQDKKGNVVGEAKAGGLVNPATGNGDVKPGSGCR